MKTAAANRTFTVCREATRDFVMRVEAENDYDARSLVSRLTGWRFDSLTTHVKSSAVIYAEQVSA
ncbi:MULTISPECIES: hypothetical protein [unclassified Mesorhizobium]|uniref:hypothetical protein n=1 Tax=unclassified Mesorhizobium TaxID=325217 RepID=UPI00112A3896|nr:MULTISPECIES: hypothetical protein [unclassified Mesorhizobium]TPJ70487.1 hypothetical protein FJ462_07275 [Mesorhizobium sp. B2-6-7]TPJ76856.1 hypothetical protein FJ422_29545 [Mesorhizobium sp. B2-6-3]